MTPAEFRGWLAWRRQNLPLAEQRRTVHQVLAGVTVSAADRRGAFVGLHELINDGVDVSNAIDRRSEKADEPIR